MTDEAGGGILSASHRAGPKAGSCAHWLISGRAPVRSVPEMIYFHISYFSRIWHSSQITRTATSHCSVHAFYMYIERSVSKLSIPRHLQYTVLCAQAKCSICSISTQYHHLMSFLINPECRSAQRPQPRCHSPRPMRRNQPSVLLIA